MACVALARGADQAKKDIDKVKTFRKSVALVSQTQQAHKNGRCHLLRQSTKLLPLVVLVELSQVKDQPSTNNFKTPINPSSMYHLKQKVMPAKFKLMIIWLKG